MSKVMIIGIAGGTGSGKTTLSDQLIRQFGSQVTVIHHERYLKAHPELTPEERRSLNYDCPEAYDTALMAAHLRAMKEGQSIDCPIFDFTLLDRSGRVEHLLPTPVIVVEGILLFENTELCRLLDIKIFVDSDADIRFMRRIRRDVDRGMALDAVMAQYLKTVKPMHERYVEPSKKNADLIVLEGGRNQVALEMIIDRIQSHVGRRR